MNSNTLRRSLNLFEFPNSSFVFSVGFHSLIKTASVTYLSIASPEHIANISTFLSCGIPLNKSRDIH